MASITVVYMLVNVAYFAAVSKADILNSGRTVASVSMVRSSTNVRSAYSLRVATNRALYFRNTFGSQAERFLSVLVAMSALGNVMSVLFSLGRSKNALLPPSVPSYSEHSHSRPVNQELGRRGIIPFPHFFASNKPHNSPAAGLALQWLMSVIVIAAIPPGDAFKFVLNRTASLPPDLTPVDEVTDLDIC